MKAKNIAVLGGGSFGTVIANIIAQNGHNTLLWMRDAEQVKIVNRDHENPTYLPGIILYDGLKAIQNLEKAVAEADIVFVAVPSSGFRDVVRQMQPFVKNEVILVSLTKGIEAETFKLMSQILSEEVPFAKVAVVSGPNLAKEIANSSPTGAVVASTDAEVRKVVQKVLRSLTFRVYANDDMFGVELGGSLKNIYAILAGMAESKGMGHNTNSMLITRSLTEMARFGLALGADPMTFLGLSGVGDLIVTCSTPLSRNFRVGKALGEGKSIEAILAELGQVAEGVNTLKQVVEKAKSLSIEMPLAQGLYEIIYNNQNIEHIISSLLLEERGLDVEFEAGQAKQLDH
ncbi:NAD(P)H-dependent glycerol-3-phosphate dehydrogenase [Haliea sp. AH-315-K21]|uniref:Glycerol-3-phosphate dehydrogenase [NAD(P)+] n=1 Tax=SAR86 cluster bacterium TaxID=2030880 RepID=A0A2A5CEJ0_9GAMM|nr:NAD(P)H-dependent glycerol-3-phosphate dehydrogenase [Haliea sp. AH-315-K21]MBN4075203.1 NAD(P)H-dependent glycerol-3-phosphate dehydrogenase [Gammaproteobacteria bacterium AH-315-E17]PCJ42153.1 MAG: NAD(P)H-dependent glycerol-3-phosphate dehydrogenase [SAR86 cluster bacterium]